MKAKDKKSTEVVKVPKSELLALVASHLKDRSLFPEKIEAAKKYSQNVHIVHK